MLQTHVAPLLPFIHSRGETYRPTGAVGRLIVFRGPETFVLAAATSRRGHLRRAISSAALRLTITAASPSPEMM